MGFWMANALTVWLCYSSLIMALLQIVVLYYCNDLDLLYCCLAYDVGYRNMDCVGLVAELLVEGCVGLMVVECRLVV